jgi:pimeloyl-ACP methyl ester carboxylesterase
VYKSAAGEQAVLDTYRRFLQRWPVPNEQFHLPTREGPTFVIDSGPREALPVLLLHGSAFNSVTWMGDVAEWGHEFRVLAIDVIGHAGLSAASRPPYDSERYASWLDDVLAGLRLERTAIVGLSLGGWIALDYAVRRPRRVACLVLLSPGGLGRELRSSLGLLLGVLPWLLLGERGRRRAILKILGPSAVPDSPAARAVANFSTLIAKHFRQNLKKVTRFSDAALARLTMPVLAILGGRDPMLDSSETRRRLETHLPHIEVRYLPDVGHAVLGQTAVIADFLRRCAAPPPS